MTRPQTSVLTRLTNVPLFVLAGVNIWMVVGFWGQLGGGDPLPYQLFGACLAAIEVTFLVVAADAQSRGEITKARIWRGVFFVVLCLNLVADFGAIVTKTQSDQIERARHVAEYDGLRREESEASAELTDLEEALRRNGLMLPTAAIEARLRGLAERRARYEAQGLRLPRALVIETAAVEQGLAVARRADEVRRLRDRVRERLQEFGTRPEASNAQIQGLVELAGAVGVGLDPETVRVALAAALALVGKLVLVFGFWAVTPRAGRQVKPAPAVGGASESGTHEGNNGVVPNILPSGSKPRRTDPDLAFARALDDLENSAR